MSWKSLGGTRKQRLDREHIRSRKERALNRLYTVLHLTEAMSKEQVTTEAYLALKLKLITKDQARELGCKP